MAKVEIEYCVPCDLLGYALETQQALLGAYGQDLDAVSVTPGDGGVFQVRVDGHLVYDKDDREERYQLDGVKPAVRYRIGAPA